MPIYRNGTYIAFHAQGTNIPIDSDIKYYNLLKAWSAKKDDDFTFVNSHEKTSALRTNSSMETLRNRLAERLRNHSKNMVLIIGETTKFDRDWVPFEIEYAIDTCAIPIIAVYTEYTKILNPSELRNLWPEALKNRIDNNKVKCIHIPFKKQPILAAINQFNLNNYPSTAVSYYSPEAYASWGI